MKVHYRSQREAVIDQGKAYSEKVYIEEKRDYEQIKISDKQRIPAFESIYAYGQQGKHSPRKQTVSSSKVDVQGSVAQHQNSEDTVI